MASATENRLINLYINGRQAGETLNQIRTKHRRLSAEINRGKLSQQEYNQKVKELQRYKGILDDHRNKINGVNKSWNNLKTVAMGVVGGNLILGAFQKLTQFIPNMISRNAELADSFADVKKTTDLTDAGIEDLNSRLKTIDTRTARSRLLELSRDAGKLGIRGVENIAQFVKAADQIDVSLGEDLGEGAIRQIGKLNNLFKVSDTYGYEQGMLKLGSVINELGASSEAAEGPIIDFISRLAGVADQADITFSQLGGYGATLDSLGQRTETSATAVSQAIVGMFSDTETYANIAGMSLEDFTKLMNEDSNEAFITFLEGLNGNNEGLSVMTEKFDQLGIDGSRAITVLGALSGNTEELRKQQTTANRAFEEGISLTNEFAQKNNNAAGNLEKIGRAINRLWVNSAIKGAIDSVTSSLADMVEVPVSENLEQQRVRFNGLMNALTDTNTAEEDRLAIMKQLQESYGDRLGDLDLEKASLGELQVAMAQVNEQYIIEIALMTQREKIKELAEKKGQTESRRLNSTIDANKQLTETNEKLGTSYKTVEEAVESLQEKTKSANRLGAITNETQELAKLRPLLGSINIAKAQAANIGKELVEEQERELDMIGQLKKDYPELGEIIDKTYAKINGVATGSATDSEEEEEIVTTVNAVSGNEEDDPYKLGQERLKAAYEEEALISEAARSAELISAEEFEMEKLEIKMSYLALQLELARQFDKDTVSIKREATQTEIQLMDLIQQKQDDLTDAKEKAAEKEQKAAEASRAANDAKTLADQQAAEAAIESQVMRGAAAVAGAQTEHEAAVSAINSIRALIREYILQAIAGAVAKEIGSKGILGLVTGAAVGAAAGLLFDTIIPPVKMPERPAFAEGTTGFFGNEFIAGDQGREIVNPSTVIPADMTQQILAANAFSRTSPQPNFSTINDGLTYSQSAQNQRTAAGGGGGMDMGPMLAELQMMREELARSQNKRVVLTDRDWQEFRDRKDDGEARVSFRG